MKKNIFYPILILALFSCTKEQGVPGPAGSQGPAGANGNTSSADTASIHGSLTLYDEFAVFQPDASGVVITLGSGSQQYKDTSDKNGYYNFSGIPTGTYDLIYQKPGYGTMKRFGISQFGGGTASTPLPNIQLLQVPVKTAPQSFTLLSNNSTSFSFGVRLDTSSLTYQQMWANFIIYIGKKQTVGPNDYNLYLSDQKIDCLPDGSGGYTVNFSKMNIAPAYSTGINPGDKLYAVIYTYEIWLHDLAYPLSTAFDGFGDQNYYVDPQTGKIVYPNLSSPSNVVQFTF